MKHFVLVILVILCFFSPMDVLADNYLVFQGCIEGHTEAEDVHDSICVWALEKDSFETLDVNGYPIESDCLDSGCCIVLEQSTATNQVMLACYFDGELDPMLTFSLPHNVIKVYGFKGGWIYYSYINEEGVLGICRMNEDGRISYYETDSYIDSISALEDLIFSISEEGLFAFASNIQNGSFEQIFGPDQSCIASPDGETRRVFETERNPCCAWLNEESILFADSDGQLQIYNLEERTLHPYLNKDGVPIYLHLPMTNICISSDGQYLAYQTFEDNNLAKFSSESLPNTLVVLSMLDGEEIVRDSICMAEHYISDRIQLQFY